MPVFGEIVESQETTVATFLQSIHSKGRVTMSVFVVTRDNMVQGVFSSRAKADDFVQIVATKEAKRNWKTHRRNWRSIGHMIQDITRFEFIVFEEEVQ